MYIYRHNKRPTYNCVFYIQVSNKEEFDKLFEEVKNNTPPPDAPVLPDPATAEEDSNNFYNFEYHIILQ